MLKYWQLKRYLEYCYQSPPPAGPASGSVPYRALWEMSPMSLTVLLYLEYCYQSPPPAAPPCETVPYHALWEMFESHWVFDFTWSLVEGHHHQLLLVQLYRSVHCEKCCNLIECFTLPGVLLSKASTTSSCLFRCTVPCTVRNVLITQTASLYLEYCYLSHHHQLLLVQLYRTVHCEK